jgi:hypothetical protein
MPSKKEATKKPSRQTSTEKSPVATSPKGTAVAETPVKEATVQVATVVQKPTVDVESSGQTLNFQPPDSIPDHLVAEMVAVRAYHLWELRGRQHGFHSEDWANAEVEVFSLLRR